MFEISCYISGANSVQMFIFANKFNFFCVMQIFGTIVHLWFLWLFGSVKNKKI